MEKNKRENLKNKEISIFLLLLLRKRKRGYNEDDEDDYANDMIWISNKNRFLLASLLE